MVQLFMEAGCDHDDELTHYFLTTLKRQSSSVVQEVQSSHNINEDVTLEPDTFGEAILRATDGLSNP